MKKFISIFLILTFLCCLFAIPSLAVSSDESNNTIQWIDVEGVFLGGVEIDRISLYSVSSDGSRTYHLIDSFSLLDSNLTTDNADLDTSYDYGFSSDGSGLGFNIYSSAFTNSGENFYSIGIMLHPKDSSYAASFDTDLLMRSYVQGGDNNVNFPTLLDGFLKCSTVTNSGIVNGSSNQVDSSSFKTPSGYIYPGDIFHLDFGLSEPSKGPVISYNIELNGILFENYRLNSISFIFANYNFNSYSASTYPGFNGADDSTLNQEEELTNSINGTTEDGRNRAKSIFSNRFSSDFLNTLEVCSTILSKFTSNFPILSQLINYSLFIGFFGFVVGSFSLINKVSSNNSRRSYKR